MAAILQGKFDKGTSAEYWHCAVKKMAEPNAKFQKFLADHQELSDCDRKGEGDLTPLHVAAILGKEAWVRFLTQRGANVAAKDKESKTPRDYCPKLAHLLTGPAAKEEKGNDSLDKWRVAIKKGPFLNKSQHDANRIVTALLFVKPTTTVKESRTAIKHDLLINHLYKNMESICDEEGVSLTPTGTQYFPRDCLLVLPSNAIVIPHSSENMGDSYERVESLALIQSKKPVYQMTKPHQMFFNYQGAAQGFIHQAAQDYTKTISPEQPLHILLPIEGGDYYLATNEKGQSKLLIGAGILNVTLNIWRAENRFNDPKLNVEGYKAVLRKNAKDGDIANAIWEMYAQGLLPAKYGKGLISKKEKVAVYEGVKATGKTLEKWLPFLKSMNHSILIKRS